jgi:hypothetical protein
MARIEICAQFYSGCTRSVRLFPLLFYSHSSAEGRGDVILKVRSRCLDCALVRMYFLFSAGIETSISSSLGDFHHHYHHHHFPVPVPGPGESLDCNRQAAGTYSMWVCLRGNRPRGFVQCSGKEGRWALCSVPGKKAEGTNGVGCRLQGKIGN